MAMLRSSSKIGRIDWARLSVLESPSSSFCTATSETSTNATSKADKIVTQGYPKKNVINITTTSKPLGFSPGIFKAIIVGEVGQRPTQKILKNGSPINVFVIGTGGLRNNRKPYEGESAEVFAERSFMQWHRVCVFKPGLQTIAAQLKKGMNVYVEGNIETRVYSDPITGLPKRLREISVRQNGRLYVMDHIGAPATTQQENIEAAEI